jgi:hypothetical protein
MPGWIPSQVASISRKCPSSTSNTRTFCPPSRSTAKTPLLRRKTTRSTWYEGSLTRISTSRPHEPRRCLESLYRRRLSASGDSRSCEIGKGRGGHDPPSGRPNRPDSRSHLARERGERKHLGHARLRSESKRERQSTPIILSRTRTQASPITTPTRTAGTRSGRISL